MINGETKVGSVDTPKNLDERVAMAARHVVCSERYSPISANTVG